MPLGGKTTRRASDIANCRSCNLHLLFTSPLVSRLLLLPPELFAPSLPPPLPSHLNHSALLPLPRPTRLPPTQPFLFLLLPLLPRPQHPPRLPNPLDQPLHIRRRQDDLPGQFDLKGLLDRVRDVLRLVRAVDDKVVWVRQAGRGLRGGGGVEGGVGGVGGGLGGGGRGRGGDEVVRREGDGGGVEGERVGDDFREGRVDGDGVVWVGGVLDWGNTVSS